MRTLFCTITLASTLMAAGGAAQAQATDAGKKAYQECVACHSVEKDTNGVGPSLFGIAGSKAAAVPGFQFSGPMKRSGIVWTPENLDKYLTDPQALVTGTRMPYSGMADAKMRAELIKYLATLK